ncbi:MAG: TetR/AcrR family transcriptional regulator [Lachnospiraceae bacterium]|nr:TetR/AcrR family transcriptional regulator [Lachnospiraceae bacterium]
MGEKSEQKRSYILKQARTVFAEKGFKAVTMKDIVDVCDISRGGLYLYFKSPEEIFREILLSDQDGEEGELPGGITRDTPMADLLMLFLKEQKKEILRKKDDIAVAAYEFFFADRAEKKQEDYARSQFDKAVKVLAGILEEGALRGEFYCPDARAAATGIMYSVEGMKICARTMGLSENKVDRQLLYIVEGLVLEDS